MQISGAKVTFIVTTVLAAGALWFTFRPSIVGPAAVEAAQGASPTPVLVELFTSEGCSSCPPADRLLRELDARQDVPGAHVVVLSEHVDYWNNLGWRDPFSSEVWTGRQQHYAGLLQQSEVYTPQAVVDGARDAVGSNERTLRERIGAAARQAKQPLTITSADWDGSGVTVKFAGGPYPGATVFAVLADERDHSKVEAGENSGVALEHVAVARALVPFRPGEMTARLAAPPEPAATTRAGHVRVIVFAQAPDGRIVAIAERPA